MIPNREVALNAWIMLWWWGVTQVLLALREEELAVHCGLVLVKNKDVIRSSETSRAAAGNGEAPHSTVPLLLFAVIFFNKKNETLKTTF